MAHHKQALKRHRQNLKRRARNRHNRASARTWVKRARLALAEGDTAQAAPAVRLAAAKLDRYAAKGAIPKARAARLKSRLMTQLAKLEG